MIEYGEVWQAIRNLLATNGFDGATPIEFSPAQMNWFGRD